MMRVVVVGGGLAGLAAAYELSRSGFEVSVFEREAVFGGMLASYRIGGYWIERYYHHMFESDVELRALIEELGLGERLLWLYSTTGYYSRGRVYPLNTPLEILRFPDLSFSDLLRLAVFVFRARRIADPLPLDGITARDWLLQCAGESLFEGFFAPLLKSKFGENMDRVSAAWLFGRVQIRSNRDRRGEILGYLRGGFQQLIDALVRRIVDSGGRVFCRAPVDRLVVEDDVLSGVETGGCFVPCDAVISTVPPFELQRLCDLSGWGLDVGDIRYQGTACLLLRLRKRLMDDVYWLNIKPDAPFGAVIEHTNLLPSQDYGDEHLVYLTAYFQNPEDKLMRLGEGEVAELYISGLEKLFPSFNRSDVIGWHLFRGMDTAPVYEVGYQGKILPYASPVKGLYLAGMFSPDNYPERSMNGSLRAGLTVAGEIRKAMGR